MIAAAKGSGLGNTARTIATTARNTPKRTRNTPSLKVRLTGRDEF